MKGRAFPDRPKQAQKGRVGLGNRLVWRATSSEEWSVIPRSPGSGRTWRLPSNCGSLSIRSSSVRIKSMSCFMSLECPFWPRVAPAEAVRPYFDRLHIASTSLGGLLMTSCNNIDKHWYYG
jgi:hypothetical protein